MNKFAQKALNAGADTVLEIILASLGQASMYGTYQEEEPTALLEKVYAERAQEKRAKRAKG